MSTNIIRSVMHILMTTSSLFLKRAYKMLK